MSVAPQRTERGKGIYAHLHSKTGKGTIWMIISRIFNSLTSHYNCVIGTVAVIHELRGIEYMIVCACRELQLLAGSGIQ